jgi:hypothetical protein
MAIESDIVMPVRMLLSPCATRANTLADNRSGGLSALAATRRCHTLQCNLLIRNIDFDAGPGVTVQQRHVGIQSGTSNGLCR